MAPGEPADALGLMWGKILSIAPFMGKYFCPFGRGQLAQQAQPEDKRDDLRQEAGSWVGEPPEPLAAGHLKSAAKHKAGVSAPIWIRQFGQFQVMTQPETARTGRDMSEGVQARTPLGLPEVPGQVSAFCGCCWPT